MVSVLKEIEKIRRRDSEPVPDEPANRYMLLYRNRDRTKTAYCFSVPIRNQKTNGIVDLCFRHRPQGSMFTGSGATVTVGESVILSDPYGGCCIRLPGKLYRKTGNAVFFDCFSAELRPTLNGVLLLADGGGEARKMEFTLNAEPRFTSVRANGKYFSVMREKFIPHVTVSCIGVWNREEKVTAPCELHHRKIGDAEYAMTVTASGQKGRIAVEINLQEPKLFQDTTVESRHPSLNNAFGGISFLGESGSFGEQWLYSRLESTGIPQLQGREILRSVLHIPQAGCSQHPLTVHRIAARFCSFGSDWGNRIAVSDPIAESTASDGYYHFDLTRGLHNLERRSENFVIRAKTPDRPAVIPTGDSFFMPQILEVTYS